MSPQDRFEFEPGTVIELANITELPALEDVIKSRVDPGFHEEYWVGRVNIRDLIRPPKFNGRLGNIALTVMCDPYNRLLDARERGFNIGAGDFRTKIDEVVEKTIGLSMTADASSTGRGVIGQLQTELWYYPLWRKRTEIDDLTGQGVSRIQRGDGYGRGIQRIVAKPKIEKEKFIELDETAKRIGFDVLQKAIQNPISTPMQN